MLQVNLIDVSFVYYNDAPKLSIFAKSAQFNPETEFESLSERYCLDNGVLTQLNLDTRAETVIPGNWVIDMITERYEPCVHWNATDVRLAFEGNYDNEEPLDDDDIEWVYSYVNDDEVANRGVRDAIDEAIRIVLEDRKD